MTQHRKRTGFFVRLRVHPNRAKVGEAWGPGGRDVLGFFAAGRGQWLGTIHLYAGSAPGDVVHECYHAVEEWSRRSNTENEEMKAYCIDNLVTGVFGLMVEEKCKGKKGYGRKVRK
jgi:hypothetical protein